MAPTVVHCVWLPAPRGGRVSPWGGLAAKHSCNCICCPFVSRSVPGSRLAVLAALHAQLWLGRGSVPRVNAMQRPLDVQTAAHEQARQVNARQTSEVHDLKEGLDMVEEKARSELGMVKPNEVYVHFILLFLFFLGPIAALTTALGCPLSPRRH